jgi:hypothetical protein
MRWNKDKKKEDDQPVDEAKDSQEQPKEEPKAKAKSGSLRDKRKEVCDKINKGGLPQTEIDKLIVEKRALMAKIRAEEQ